MTGGKASQAKGRRGENNLVGHLRAHGFPAKRISAPYKDGPDVEAFNGRTIEVKSHMNLPSVTLEKWLSDANLVAVKGDWTRFRFYLVEDELYDIIDEYRGVCATCGAKNANET